VTDTRRERVAPATRADGNPETPHLPRQASGGGSSSFQGSGRASGTKADEEERKKQRLAALEAAQTRGAQERTGTDVDAMRAEILREREKRRAAMKGSISYGNDGRGATRSGEPTEKRAIEDPARARVAAAIARLESLNPNPSTLGTAALTLCRIACNACEDAFGDTAPTFANSENAFALATDFEKNAATTRVDRRSVKLANAKVREAFFGNREPEPSANEDEDEDVSGGDESSPAVDAFLAAGFVLENDAATDVDASRDEDVSLKNNRASVDARRLTLPYAADVRLVSFLAERLAAVAAAASPLAAPLAAKAARLAAPGYRKARAVDPTKPPAGGRGARAFVPPVGGSAAARAQLDDAFFRRDASEVAAEFARAKAAREASSALTTRAWKEARKKEEEEEDKKTKRTDPVTVRVRLPDGTQLRGMFGPREPIGAVRAFVHESLREPFRRFDLAFLGAPLRGDEGDETSDANGAKAAKPRDSLTGLRTHNVRAPSNPNGLTGSVSSKSARVGHKGVGYGEEGTVAGAGLAPSALITFSWAEPARPGENTDGDPRVLNDALSRDAQPLE
jgi:UBX domain-containing protein 6